MERFIGLDVHASSTTMAVVSATGKRLRSQVVATSAEALIDALKVLRGELHLCLEECAQSTWLHELLSPHVAELVVVGIDKQSRGPKSDAQDAFGLAEKLRLRDYKTPVFKPVGSYTRLRQLSRAHRQVVTDVTRVQARIKALLRSRGVAATGKQLYSTTGRQPVIAALPSHTRPACELLFNAYDALVPVRQAAEHELVQELHRHAISRVLESCPGFGPIRIAEVLATVVTPQRFRTRQQFWSYCGLGIVMRSSSDWVQLPDGSWQRAQLMKTNRRLQERRSAMSWWSGQQPTSAGRASVGLNEVVEPGRLLCGIRRQGVRGGGEDSTEETEGVGDRDERAAVEADALALMAPMGDWSARGEMEGSGQGRSCRRALGS